MKLRTVAVVITIALFSLASYAGENVATSRTIPKNSKIYVSAMPDGFDTYLKSALDKKKVPVEVVEDKDKADFVITGASESQKAGTAKKILYLDWRSREEASITVADNKTGEVVFSYSVHKSSSNHGKQSTAEACAKHLKERIDDGK